MVAFVPERKGSSCCSQGITTEMSHILLLWLSTSEPLRIWILFIFCSVRKVLLFWTCIKLNLICLVFVSQRICMCLPAGWPWFKPNPLLSVWIKHRRACFSFCSCCLWLSVWLGGSVREDREEVRERERGRADECGSVFQPCLVTWQEGRASCTMTHPSRHLERRRLLLVPFGSASWWEAQCKQSCEVDGCFSTLWIVSHLLPAGSLSDWGDRLIVSSPYQVRLLNAGR